MPRTAREKSQTGIYHVMLRGIDKRDLFLKDSEYQKFIDYIQKAKDKCEFTIYAYCLMTNHIHLLIKTQTETQDVGDIVRRITVGYAQYHNFQNGRTGHLFQNRFRSEIIDNDAYFLEVLRYIHQNPLKAGMVKNIEDYQWSSINAYLGTGNILVETRFALGFFKDTKDFEAFMKQLNNDQCLEYHLKTRYTDDDLKEFVSSFVNISTLNELDIGSRNELLATIKEVTTSSNRQLSRVLNIGRGIIEKVHQK
ncbi:REP-associated tyrosine transposase [Desulfosporosinus fructosivorans]